jgi:hypothetical protein
MREVTNQQQNGKDFGKTFVRPIVLVVAWVERGPKRIRDLDQRFAGALDGMTRTSSFCRTTAVRSLCGVVFEASGFVHPGCPDTRRLGEDLKWSRLGAERALPVCDATVIRTWPVRTFLTECVPAYVYGAD